MSKTILSIIVPTYNMEDYLDKCLTSLVIGEPDSEIMCCLEVIVVNDGSTDRSSEIAHHYEHKYPNTFKVIDKKNGNYGSCINVALPIASGTYVKVLDADDSFDRDAFLLYLNEIKDLDVDVILTEFCEIHLSGKTVLQKKTIPLEEHKVFTWQVMIPVLNSIMSSHYFTYRRQMLIDIGYHQTEGRYYTDNEWIASPLISVQTVYYLPVFLYIYLLGRNGQTVSREVRKKSLESYKSLLLYLGKLWHSYHGDEQRKLMLYNAFSTKVKFIYHLFAFERIFKWSDFRKFDQELIDTLPEVKNVTNHIVVGGKLFPMPIIKYFRENRYLLFILARFRFYMVEFIKRTK